MEIAREFFLERFINSQQSREEKIVILLAQLQYHRPEIYTHSIRVGELAVLLAKFITDKEWTTEELGRLRLCGFLHDIGKLKLTREILRNPVDLSGYNLRKAHEHTLEGGAIIDDCGLLSICSAVARQHHENYSGDGYPQKLKGEDINLYARIVRIVDVFDASINPHRMPRPAEKLLSFEEVVTSMQADFSDGRFDPTLKTAFEEFINYLRPSSQLVPVQSNFAI